MRFNYLVKEWAWRVNNGMPDPKKRTHLQILEDVLRDYKYSEEFIQEYILQIEAVCQQGQNPGRDGCVAADGSKGGGKKVEKEPKKDKEKSEKESSVSSKKNTENQIEKFEKLKDDLDFILEHKDATRLKSGSGSNTPSHEDVRHLKEFTEKRMEQDKRRLEAEEKGEEFDEEPYVHPDIDQNDVDDKTLDKSIDYLEEKLEPKEFSALMKKFATGGAVPPHLTKLKRLKKGEEGYPGYDKNSPGYKRAREIIRLYLKNEGKDPVTGKPLPLSHMVPDHRVPFATAENDLVNSGKFEGLSQKKKKPADGNSIEEIVKKKKSDRTDRENEIMTALEPLQAKYDSPVNNMDLMSGPINSFKSDAIDNELLTRIKKELLKNPEEKKLKQKYESERKRLLDKHYIDQFAV